MNRPLPTQDKPVKCYVINPFARTVTENQYRGDYRELYDLIGCDCFTTVTVNREHDSIFVDDEGLIRNKPQEFFAWKGYEHPLAGIGVILGCDEEGESVEPVMTLDQVRSSVAWITPVQVAGGVIFVEEE